MSAETPSAPSRLPPSSGAELGPDDFDAIDDILDDLRQREEEIPQWEFCEGFMAALICTRRDIPPAEYLPVLLGDTDPEVEVAPGPDAVPRLAAFANAAQQARFLGLWRRRWDEIAAALDAPVESLDDDRTYHPEAMDVRGALASLPEEERAEVPDDEEIPSFAQVWALGFMYAVETWPEEWAAPRDKEAAEWLDDALQSIVALSEDDTGTPEVSMLGEDGPPSISQQRVDDFGAAIWAVYDLRRIWKSLGPRVDPVRRADTPGRNDPCPCGSGKKYKKCHGAG
jgi:uncharacterized protein